MCAINEEQMEPKFADKSWNPAVEQTIWKKWEDNNIYQFSIIEQKHAFVIDSLLHIHQEDLGILEPQLTTPK